MAEWLADRDRSIAEALLSHLGQQPDHQTTRQLGEGRKTKVGPSLTSSYPRKHETVRFPCFRRGT